MEVGINTCIFLDSPSPHYNAEELLRVNLLIQLPLIML